MLQWYDKLGNETHIDHVRIGWNLSTISHTYKLRNERGRSIGFGEPHSWFVRPVRVLLCPIRGSSAQKSSRVGLLPMSAHILMSLQHINDQRFHRHFTYQVFNIILSNVLKIRLIQTNEEFTNTIVDFSNIDVFQEISGTFYRTSQDQEVKKSMSSF
ncbi:hypothetical protein HanRHA438_Chr06g0282691 [Helianthus annuus]|nr:hypothetical protein HanRHA438_Chr06g0282691 [Helianthus annuus]